MGGPSFSDFLLNSTEHVGASFGDNSWSLAFWNVFVGGFTDASNDALHGDYTAAAIGIGMSVVKPARAFKHIPGSAIPGRVLSRINVSNAGWAHILERHFAGAGSRFSIPQAQLRSLLGSRQVVGTPVLRTLDSADGTRFVRQLDVGYTIGVDNFSGTSTSTLTVLTDKFGNLVTAFPGILR